MLSDKRPEEDTPRMLFENRDLKETLRACCLSQDLSRAIPLSHAPV